MSSRSRQARSVNRSGSWRKQLGTDCLREPVPASSSPPRARQCSARLPDLAVRQGLGKYPGLNAIRLVAPEFIVVASPDLLKNRAPLREPAECLAFPLLHDLNRQDWPLWFEAHGVAAPDCKKGPAFSENHLILRAAVAGQGLALVRDIYAEDDVRSKKLVRALTVNWPLPFAYYAVATSEALQKPAVRRFRDWLVEEAGQEL